MREYTNEIDKRVIDLILSDEQKALYKKVAKEYKELSQQKREIESYLKQELYGFVIGELDGVELNYMAYTDNFYVSYIESNDSFMTRLFWRIQRAFK